MKYTKGHVLHVQFFSAKTPRIGVQRLFALAAIFDIPDFFPVVVLLLYAGSPKVHQFAGLIVAPSAISGEFQAASASATMEERKQTSISRP